MANGKPARAQSIGAAWDGFGGLEAAERIALVNAQLDRFREGQKCGKSDGEAERWLRGFLAWSVQFLPEGALATFGQQMLRLMRDTLRMEQHRNN